MQFKKIKDKIYVRVDPGEKVIETLRAVCKKEGITSGHFQGIGACRTAVISTYIPEKQDFKDHSISGMIEMVTLMGNLSEDAQSHTEFHSHAVFSYLSENGEPVVVAGHLKDAEISYTGELVLTISEERIGRAFNKSIGIDVWELS
jgi:Predicted DNA-binding protein with PD1-like DNA-binding motif